jgi:vancomycin permeability regulator SanA
LNTDDKKAINKAMKNKNKNKKTNKNKPSIRLKVKENIVKIKRFFIKGLEKAKCFLQRTFDLLLKVAKIKIVKRAFVSLVSLPLIAGLLTFSLNLYVKQSVKDSFLSVDEASSLSDIDCIIVLGCGINDNGEPSDMLRDRLNFAIDIYKKNGSTKLLMSGDHGRVGYNEVGVMKKYAIEKGVPSEDIFMDHAGFSTYETMYRAKAIFQAEKVVVVTQEYHLYRGVYIAEEMGMEAYGVASDVYWYQNEFYRETREAIARCKDFVWCVFKPEPTYLGETIPVSGNGDLTNDY